MHSSLGWSICSIGNGRLVGQESCGQSHRDEFRLCRVEKQRSSRLVQCHNTLYIGHKMLLQNVGLEVSHQWGKCIHASISNDDIEVFDAKALEFLDCVESVRL